MNANEIKQEFDKNVNRFVDGVVVAKGAITGVLNQACGGDDNRHLVLKALTDSTSSRSMSEAQWFALLQFVQPYKPEGQRWQSQRGDDLRVECGILLTSLADQEGQLKMFEEGKHQKSGICTCGKKPEEHPDKKVLTYHHYWYMHKGLVNGCSICEMAEQ